MPSFTRKRKETERRRITTPDDVVAYVRDDIRWYGGAADSAKAWYRTLKIFSITAAAAIPVLALLKDVESWVPAVLGALITVIEGLQQTLRFHERWISYRSTAEALSREVFLCEARSGEYLGAGDDSARYRLLAQRFAETTASENTKWLSFSEEKAKGDSSGGGGSEG
jgi:hypothetical protein